MAGDARSVTSLRRQGSTASGHSSLTLQQRTPTTAAFEPAEPVEPVSAHVADPFLHDFLQPGFDPAAYWNAALGPAAGTANTTAKPRGSSVADQAATAQTALSQLAAHTTRLSTVLSQLTDDILRSGSRLAYEVELLRGETIGLAEVLDKVGQALPGGSADSASAPSGLPSGSASDADAEPPALAQLRMLAQVRSRLDAVIRTFGDAMEFVVPPSALSVGASFLSVSGPEAGAGKATPAAATTVPATTTTTPSAGGTDTTSLEDKGQQVLKARREEIVRLLENPDGLAGVEAAGARVAALRALCQVWTGTAEEKARLKFVDGLQRLVEDRQRQVEREKQAEEQAAAAAAAAAAKPAKTATAGGGKDGSGSTLTVPAASSSTQDAGTASPAAAATAQAKGGGSYAGYGFISQLQKIRGGL